MRTASAYISKIHAEALGRNYKVQDTNHRLMTFNVYRGAAGCGSINYSQIRFINTCKVPRINQPPCVEPIPIIRTYFGGTPSSSGPLLFGGTPPSSGPRILNGGNP